MVQREPLLFRHYLLGFILTITLALFLLLLSAFMPQSFVLKNINKSIGGLNTEGLHPYTYDLQDSASLDTFSDVQMLRASATMHRGNLSSILTNEYYSYTYAEDIIEELERCSLGEEPDSGFHYVRYWMGFRAFLRVCLVFLSYFQIRRYLGFAFFCLLFALVFHITKHTNEKLGFLFAVSVILVRPNVIVSSLQYTCCFFIAFIAMFLIPWLYRNPKWDMLFFMEVGMITMYFDFYTVPLITFGYPMVYLLALQAMNQKHTSVKKICTLLLCWLLGWVLMWFTKLGLTSLFTPINGIANGIHSFFNRIGIVKQQDLLQYYSIPYAFLELFRAIFADFEGAVIYMLGVAVCFIAIILKTIKNKIPLRTFFTYKYFGIIALLPIIWFVITAQPIAIHAFFQYRSIAIIYWSIGAYIFTVFEDRKLGSVT